MPHKGQIFNNSRRKQMFEGQTGNMGRDKDSIRLSCPFSAPKRLWPQQLFIFIEFAPWQAGISMAMPLPMLMLMMMGLLLNILTFPSSCFPAAPQNADNVFSLYYIYFDSHRIRPLSSASAAELRSFSPAIYEVRVLFKLFTLWQLLSANPRRRLIS